MTRPSRATPNHWHYWPVPAVALTLLAIVSIGDGNRALFLSINHLSAYTGDTLWTDLTIFGNGAVILALAIPLVGRRPEMIFAVIIAALITALTVKGFKAYFHAPRPPAVLPRDLFHVIGPAYRSASFPSGHTATAFVFAGVVSLTFARGWVTLTAVAMAGAVGLSRVVVGVHWPADVLGGAALGWLCAVVAYWLAAPWSRNPSNVRLRRWLRLPLYTAAAALLWPHITAYPAARPVQYAVAVLSLAGAGFSLYRTGRRRG